MTGWLVGAGVLAWLAALAWAVWATWTRLNRRQFIREQIGRALAESLATGRGVIRMRGYGRDVEIAHLPGAGTFHVGAAGDPAPLVVPPRTEFDVMLSGVIEDAKRLQAGRSGSRERTTTRASATK